MTTLNNNAIDAALDAIDEDTDGASAEALADLLDKHGQWDWTDDAEHDPSDRLAVVESTGAYWVVYRGTEPDQAWRFATRAEADEKFAGLKDVE